MSCSRMKTRSAWCCASGESISPHKKLKKMRAPAWAPAWVLYSPWCNGQSGHLS